MLNTLPPPLLKKFRDLICFFNGKHFLNLFSSVVLFGGIIGITGFFRAWEIGIYAVYPFLCETNVFHQNYISKNQGCMYHNLVATIYSSWPLYRVVAVLVFVIEYPRGKRAKGRTTERKYADENFIFFFSDYSVDVD